MDNNTESGAAVAPTPPLKLSVSSSDRAEIAKKHPTATIVDSGVSGQKWFSADGQENTMWVQGGDDMADAMVTTAEFANGNLVVA